LYEFGMGGIIMGVVVMVMVGSLTSRGKCFYSSDLVKESDLGRF
jgi:hypothetical protein